MKNIKLLTFLVALATVGLTSLPALADAPLVSITGTVVSLSGDDLVLKTDKGDLTFDLDKSTEKPASIAVGSRITVWYDSDDNPADHMDARRIEAAPAMTPPATGTEMKTKTETETETHSEMRYDETQQREELPRTATPLALMSGAGFLALAGGEVLRRMRGRK